MVLIGDNDLTLAVVAADIVRRVEIVALGDVLALDVAGGAADDNLGPAILCCENINISADIGSPDDHGAAAGAAADNDIVRIYLAGDGICGNGVAIRANGGGKVRILRIGRRGGGTRCRRRRDGGRGSRTGSRGI